MDEDQIKQYQEALREAQIRNAEEGIARQQSQNIADQEENKSIVREQLDLTEEITRIDYLIKGYSLEPNAETQQLEWVKPVTDDLQIFSDYGVHLIRNTICWYLNKNLLLSNYDDVVIKKKMLNFTNDLIDTIFMEYDKVFKQPSVEECIEILKERVARKSHITAFAQEMAGLTPDIVKIQKEKLQLLEGRIEQELEKIKETVIKSRLKRFVLIVRVIQDSVHNTYMRAWKGQERSTLRQHTHITENRNPLSVQPRTQGGMFPWSKK